MHCSFIAACWHLPPLAPAVPLKQLLVFPLRHPARCSDGSCSSRRAAEERQRDPEGHGLGGAGLGLCTCQSAQAKHHLLRGLMQRKKQGQGLILRARDAERQACICFSYFSRIAKEKRGSCTKSYLCQVQMCTRNA